MLILLFERCIPFVHSLMIFGCMIQYYWQCPQSFFIEDPVWTLLFKEKVVYYWKYGWYFIWFVESLKPLIASCQTVLTFLLTEIFLFFFFFSFSFDLFFLNTVGLCLKIVYKDFFNLLTSIKYYNAIQDLLIRKKKEADFLNNQNRTWKDSICSNQSEVDNKCQMTPLANLLP